MEALLLARVAAIATAFLQQDLRCAKCHTVREELVQPSCQAPTERSVTVQVGRGGMTVQCDLCGGELQHCVAPKTAVQQLRVLNSVAAFHGMTLLQDVTEWHLKAACDAEEQH